MATVKITPDLDTKPALKNFKKFTKTMTQPIGLGKSLGKDVDKFMKKFTYKSQIKEVKGLRSEFSKMASGVEKSQKKQEIHSKVQRMRAIQAAKAPFQYAAKAYKQSEINQSYHSGAGGAGAFMGNASNVVGGGFASTVSTQLSAVKNAKDYAYKKYEDYKQAQANKRQSSRENGLNSSENTENGGSGGSSGLMGKAGGFLSSAGSGIAIIEGLSKAAGFMVGMASSIGEKRTAVINSQSATLGQTEGYVGGGGGLFANSQMAQAQVAYNRSMNSKDGKVGISGKESLMNFSSKTGLGIPQAAEAMGEIHKSAKDIKIEFIKGAATQSKMFGLKQGEFLTSFAGVVKSNKEAGFGEMSSSSMKSFLSLTAGLSQNGVSTGRGMSIMQGVDENVRKGQNGGIMGQLGLVKRLNENGGDYFEARRKQEKEGVTESDFDFMRKILPKEVFSEVMNQNGMSLQEGDSLYGTKGKKISNENIGLATPNAGLARQNLNDSFYADPKDKNNVKLGPKIDELLDQMQKDNHALVTEIMPILAGTVKTVAELEKRFMGGIEKSISGLEFLLKKVF